MPTYNSNVSTPGVKYVVSVSLTRKSATKASCSVSCTTYLTSGSDSFLGTGHYITGSLWIPGVGEKTWAIKGSSEKWSGTGSHGSKGGPWDVPVGPETTSLSGFQFKATNGYGNAGDLGWQSGFAVSVGSGVTNVKTDHADVSIEGSALSQAEAYVSLSDIPKDVGYTRTLNWYIGDELKESVNVSAEEHKFMLSGLVPNTMYKVTAELRIGSKTGTVITAKSVSITTPQETGKLALTPKSTYITAQISEMFDTPNYERVLEFYIKKDEDSEYALVASVAAQGTTGQANLTGLLSNSRYDVKVLIKNGGTTLRTFTDSVETIADLSLIPTADIESISQQLGTRRCTITWITDKAVAGTIYKIEAMAEGESEWTVLDTLTDITSPVVVTAHDGNVDMVFRISSANETVAEGLVNHSDEFAFYVRDDFLWDVDKVAGQPLIITANEWNRLREYAIARCETAGLDTDIPLIRAGDSISAETYNTMKNNISMVNFIDIADKQPGDVIAAADIDALRLAVNNTAA